MRCFTYNRPPGYPTDWPILCHCPSCQTQWLHPCPIPREGYPQPPIHREGYPQPPMHRERPPVPPYVPNMSGSEKTPEMLRPRPMLYDILPFPSTPPAMLRRRNGTRREDEQQSTLSSSWSSNSLLANLGDSGGAFSAAEDDVNDTMNETWNESSRVSSISGRREGQAEVVFVPRAFTCRPKGVYVSNRGFSSGSCKKAVTWLTNQDEDVIEVHQYAKPAPKSQREGKSRLRRIMRDMLLCRTSAADFNT